MDVVIEIDGPLLSVTVTQNGTTATIMDEVNVVTSAPDSAAARTDGVLGLRAWGGNDLTIGSMKLYVLD
jgi:hypothetical protein